MPGFDLNTVTLSGNLTRDPEMRELPNGNSVCNMRIAANDRRKQGEEWVNVPMYFDVTIWSGFGKYQGENLKRGDGVIVSGRLMWREFTDKDANKRQAVSITADTCIKRERSNGNSDAPADPANAPKDAPSAVEPPPPF